MKRIVALLTASGLLLAACAVGPHYRRPGTEVPASYKNSVTPAAATPAPGASSAPGAPGTAATAPDDWWTLFDDQDLDRLVGEVEVSNQNLAQAVAAYEQAEAAVRVARAAFFPTVTGDASATRVSGSSRAGTVGSIGSVSVGASGGGGGSSTLYQVTGSASWELDVWGRLRRSLENAKATAQASAADLAFARLSAQGQLAT